MRRRDYRVGLVVSDNGQLGVTSMYKGQLVVEYYSVWGGEGFTFMNLIPPRQLKLVMRLYNPYEK